MGIPRRAESTDRSALAMTFVAAGSFSAMLHSTDHQILYGRRGTGKTHALLYLSDLIERTGDVAVYLDLRTIGSAGGIYTGSNLSPTVRGTHLLVDTLEAIHEELLIVAWNARLATRTACCWRWTCWPSRRPRFRSSVRWSGRPQLVARPESSVGIELTVSPNAKVSAARAGSPRPRAVAADRDRTASRGVRAVISVHSEAYQRVESARVVVAAGRMESVPLDLQPLLADLLRRSVLPTRGSRSRLRRRASVAVQPACAERGLRRDRGRRRRGLRGQLDDS